VKPTFVARQGTVFFFFFFITLKPRVERYKKSMSLKYEPASEPLHISETLNGKPWHPLSSEYCNKTVKARFWPWLSGEMP